MATELPKVMTLKDFYDKYGVDMACSESFPDKKTPDKGIKFDTEKPRMDLIPPLSLIETAKVLGYGAKKYSADNWRLVDGKEWRYFGAAQRHLWAYKSGEKFDKETGINHLAHAICSLMFLLELDEESKSNT